MKIPHANALMNGVFTFYAQFVPVRAWRAALSRPVLAPRGETRMAQLLVDVSAILRHDARTGIQRAVRGILKELMRNPPAGFAVRPVFATRRHGYRYIEGDVFAAPAPGGRMAAGRGDVFLGLDLTMDVLPQHQAQLMALKLRGLAVHLMVYDVLPLQRPEWFSDNLVRHFRRWAQAVARVADRVHCISVATRDAFLREIPQRHGIRREAIDARVVPLASDIESSIPSGGLPQGAENLLARMKAQGAVLMVGTVEPRKGYAQALAAFDRLWQSGRNEMLVIAGKPGWKTEVLQQRLRSHHENGNRLFWLETVSDEYLVRLYEVARGLFMTSEAEGFGLPLVEANRLGKRVLARDIPVFREIMDAAATYFDNDAAEALSAALAGWLDAPSAPQATGPLCGLTWGDVARHIAAGLRRLPPEADFAETTMAHMTEAGGAK